MSQLNVQQGLQQNKRRLSEAARLITMETLDAKQISTNIWAILIFLGYIIIGVAFYSLGPRQLSALDAVYLAIITFSTVGYGDIQIQHRYFACFYVLLGVAVVGTFFGIFSNDIMEAQEEAMQKRLVQVAKRIDVMFYDSARQLNDYRKRKMTEVSDIIRNGGNPASEHTEQAEEVVSEMKKANLEAFDDELREIRSKGIVDFFFILLAIFSGCLCMVLIESWSFEQGIYWAIVTVTTVGYGDVTPSTAAGKIFTIFYVCIGCSLAAKGFRDFVCYPLVLRAKENETKIIEQFGENLSERTLRSILSCDLLHKIPRLQVDASQMTKSEFTVLVLRLMNKVQEKDILLASQIFDRLDIAQDGILSESDQADQIAKARQRDREKQIEMQRQLAEEAQNERGRRLTELFTNILVNPLTATAPTTPTHHSYFGLVGEAVSNPVHSKRKSSKIIEEEDVEDPFARRVRRSVSWTPNFATATIDDVEKEEDDDDDDDDEPL